VKHFWDYTFDDVKTFCDQRRRSFSLMFPDADTTLPGHDDVVQELDANGLGHLLQSPRDRQVFRAWRRVARRMIVYQNHRGGGIADSRPENLTRRDQWMKKLAGPW
jgi:glyoxylase-like metal-dependent hydrolase (beta-lactamase superfamily II)